MNDLELEKLHKDFEGQKISEVNMLFLDLSGSCTGYCIAAVNFDTKKATFKNAGAIWFEKDMTNQEKYHFLFSSIVNYFNIIGQIDYCVAEAYMMNVKRIMGCQVGPELHGAIQVALAEIGVKYSTIYTQTWRKQLEIRKDAKGDFKEPTKQKVLEYTPLPDEIQSNVTKTLRKTPNDVTDAIAIGLGSLKKLGIDKYDFSKIKFQESLTY